MAECNNLADFSEADKKWFAQALPDGTYGSADEVSKALGDPRQLFLPAKVVDAHQLGIQ